MARDMTGRRNKLISKNGNKCACCDYPGYIEIHHINPVCEGGDSNMDNLIMLCEKCHATVHGKKKYKYIDKARENWGVTNG